MLITELRAALELDRRRRLSLLEEERRAGLRIGAQVLALARAHPKLRFCGAHFAGFHRATFEEAMANLKEAVALCLEDEQPGESSRFIGVRDLEIVQ